jgi:hypothetical protein
MSYPQYPGRHGGDKVVHPEVGSLVTVKPGLLFEGKKVRVLDVKGYLYAIAFRVYVETPDGVETWYWPWELVF